MKEHFLGLSACLVLCGCANTGSGDQRAVEAAWQQAKTTLVGTPLKTLDACAQVPVARNEAQGVEHREYYSHLSFWGGMSSMTCTLGIEARNGVVDGFSTRVTSTGGAPRFEFTCVYPVQSCLRLARPFDFDAKVSYSPADRTAAEEENKGLVNATLGLSRASAAMLGMSNPSQYSNQDQGGETRRYGAGGVEVGGSSMLGAAATAAGGRQSGGSASGYILPPTGGRGSTAALPSVSSDAGAGQADVESAIAQAEAKLRTLPDKIDGCPTRITHLADRLPICRSNKSLMQLRRYWLATDASFREDQAAGFTLAQVATINAQAARKYEDALKQSEAVMLETVADGQLARRQIAALRQTPPVCDAAPEGTLSMPMQAYQTYVVDYISAVSSRAVSSIAACRAQAAR